jgi:hypothetical protein
MKLTRKQLSYGLSLLLVAGVVSIWIFYAYASSSTQAGHLRPKERAALEVEKFLQNPESCKTPNVDAAALAKLTSLAPTDRKLVVTMNSLPKRIDFDVVQISTGKVVGNITYKPDRGCAGILI